MALHRILSSGQTANEQTKTPPKHNTIQEKQKHDEKEKKEPRRDCLSEEQLTVSNTTESANKRENARWI